MTLDPATLAVAAAVAVAVLGVIYFAVRFWLVSTRPADIRDVPTPNLDRLNRQALEHMAVESAEQDEAETAALADEEAPEALKSIVPPEPPPAPPAAPPPPPNPPTRS